MLNQIQLIGNLGRDPEQRFIEGEDSVTTFSIATTEKWTDKVTGELREATEWHRVAAFGKLAEICMTYLRTGALVFVQGKMRTKKWTDVDGVDRYSTSIHADTMKMLGKRDSTESASA